MKKNIRCVLLCYLLLLLLLLIRLMFDRAVFYWMCEQRSIYNISYLANNCRKYMYTVWWYFIQINSIRWRRREEIFLWRNKFISVNNVQWTKTMKWTEMKWNRSFSIHLFATVDTRDCTRSNTHERAHVHKYVLRIHNNFQYPIRKTLFTPASSFTVAH